MHIWELFENLGILPKIEVHFLPARCRLEIRAQLLPAKSGFLYPKRSFGSALKFDIFSLNSGIFSVIFVAQIGKNLVKYSPAGSHEKGVKIMEQLYDSYQCFWPLSSTDITATLYHTIEFYVIDVSIQNIRSPLRI